MYLLFLAVFLSFSVEAAQEFYISEIFANRPGRSTDAGSEWIELHNISPYQIAIDHLAIEIFNAANEVLFSTQLPFDQSVLFENRLLLAHKKDLSLPLCLSTELLIIPVPGLSIEKLGQRKICVHINQNISDCVTLPAKLRFEDGTALYRSYDGQSVQPLWRNEACHFSDSIFATPGLEEQACATQPDFSEEIIVDCAHHESRLSDTGVKELLSSKNSTPHLSVKLLPKTTETTDISVRVRDFDRSDLWRMDMCARVQPDSRVCHEITRPISMVHDREQVIGLAPWPKKLGSQLILKVRDLAGLTECTQLSSPPTSEPKFHHLKDVHLVVGTCSPQCEVHVEISSEQLPINYWLQDAKGRVHKTGAWVSKGSKSIQFKADAPETLSLVMKNLSEESTLELKEGTPASGCQTHGSDQVILWLCALCCLVYRLGFSIFNMVIAPTS